MGTPTRRAAPTGGRPRDPGRDAVDRADWSPGMAARPAEAPRVAAQSQVLRERTTSPVEPRDPATDPLLHRGARRAASAAWIAGCGSNGDRVRGKPARARRPAKRTSRAGHLVHDHP